VSPIITIYGRIKPRFYSLPVPIPRRPRGQIARGLGSGTGQMCLIHCFIGYKPPLQKATDSREHHVAAAFNAKSMHHSRAPVSVLGRRCGLEQDTNGLQISGNRVCVSTCLGRYRRKGKEIMLANEKPRRRPHAIDEDCMFLPRQVPHPRVRCQCLGTVHLLRVAEGTTAGTSGR